MQGVFFHINLTPLPFSEVLCAHVGWEGVGEGREKAREGEKGKGTGELGVGKGKTAYYFLLIDPFSSLLFYYHKGEGS